MPVNPYEPPLGESYSPPPIDWEAKERRSETLGGLVSIVCWIFLAVGALFLIFHWLSSLQR